MQDKIDAYKEVILNEEVLSLKREIELYRIRLESIQEQERSGYLWRLLETVERKNKDNEKLRRRNANLKRELDRRDAEIKRLNHRV